MPTKKGMSKPRHKPETKELAVLLYASNPFMTLAEVALELNQRFHFNPPLHGDSVGRWVQEKGEKMKRSADLIWIKRREKYGKSGLTAKKREALSKLRKVQWSSPRYKDLMRAHMSRIPRNIKKKILELHEKGNMPSKIKKALKLEQLYVPAHSTFYQIFRAKLPKVYANASIDSIIDVPCFICLVNRQVSPSKCVPGRCLRIEEWLLSSL